MITDPARCSSTSPACWPPGYLALYLMLAAIGAEADLAAVLELPMLLAAGVLWVLVHIAVLLVVGG